MNRLLTRAVVLASSFLLVQETPAQDAPFGAIVSADERSVSGWAYAADQGYNPVEVLVKVDGAAGLPVRAARLRHDLPGGLLGRHHGFEVPLPPLTPGVHQVACWARSGAGPWRWIDARSVAVSYATPGGAVSSVDVEDDAVVLRGWAYDRDAGTGPVSLVVHVDGVPVSGGLADRPDAGLLVPLGSSAHAFELTVPRPAPGVRVLAVVAENAGPGPDVALSSHDSLVLDLREHLAPLGSRLGAASARWDPATGTFRFRHDGPDPREYVVDPGSFAARHGAATVLEARSGLHPVYRAGAARRARDGGEGWPEGLALSPESEVRVLATDFDGERLELRYEETFQGVRLEKTVSYELSGKTLVVEFRQHSPRGPDVGRYSAFKLGRMLGLSNPRTVLLPYNPQPVVVDGGVFLSVYLDRSASGANATEWASGEWGGGLEHYRFTRYHADSAGDVEPLSERFYVTVSSTLEPVFPASNVPPGPHRDDAARRMVYDTWGVDRTPLKRPLWQIPFAEQTLHFQELKRVFGLDHVLVIRHNWGSYMDFAMPKLYPANEWAGGDAAFLMLSHTVREQGWLFAAHENPTDMMPPNPVAQDPEWFDLDLVAKNPDLSPRLKGMLGQEGWTVRAYAVSPDKQVEIARLHSGYLAAHYWPNAGFWDVQPYSEPLVDFDAANPHARSFADTVRHVKDAALVFREAYRGPLSESMPLRDDWSLVFAGYVDGFERELADGEHGLVVPDFELQVTRPLTANQGMGYLSRFFEPETRAEPDFPAERHHDLIRSRTVAYAHTGFVSDAILDGTPRDSGLPPVVPRSYKLFTTDQIVKEYYMLQALQTRMMEGGVETVRYHGPGGGRTLSERLVELASRSRDQDHFLELFEEAFTHPFVAVDYANGLQVRVNCHDEQDWAVTVQGRRYVLPPNGWVARRTSGGDAFTAFVAYVPGFEWTGDVWGEVDAPEYWFHDDRQGNHVTIIKPSGFLLHFPY